LNKNYFYFHNVDTEMVFVGISVPTKVYKNVRGEDLSLDENGFELHKQKPLLLESSSMPKMKMP